MKDRPRFSRLVILLTVLAVLTSLCLVVNVTPVSGAISGVTNTPAPATPGVAATQTVAFTTGAVFTTATVTFPTGTWVPATIATTNVTMTGADVMTVASVTPNPVTRAVVITLTAATTTAIQTVTATIGSTTAVITNPGAGSYTLTVATSAEAAVASAAYVIGTGAGGTVALNGVNGLSGVAADQTINVTNDVNGDNTPDAGLQALTPGGTVTIKFDRTAVGFTTAATMTTTPASVTVTLADPIGGTPGGCFYASFKVPQVPTSVLGVTQTYSVWATDGVVVTPSTNTITRILPADALLVNNVVVATPGGTTTQPAGTLITIGGAGYEGLVGISVHRAVTGFHVPATDPIIASATTDALGTYVAVFTASSTTAGQIYARDSSAANNESGGPLIGGVAAAMDVTLALQPSVTVSPASGRTNSSVTATCTDFNAGQIPWTAAGWQGPGGVGVSLITVGGVAVPSASVTAAAYLSPNTGFTITFRVPTGVPSGVATIQVTDAHATTPMTGQGSFTVDPRALTITPSSGVPGTTVNISGANFIPGALITAAANDGADILYQAVNWGPTAAQGNQTVSTVGTWAVSLLVPDSTGGHTIAPADIVIRAADNGGAIGEGTFTLLPRSVTITPDTGAATESVVVSGEGFRSLGTVTVSFGATPVLFASCDASGNFAGAFGVPIGTAAGTYTVTAADTAVAAMNAIASFIVPPQAITVDPASGPVGTTVTISGTGFTGYAQVSAVTIGGVTVLPPAGTQADASGNFSFSVTVPLLNAGVALVSATAGPTATTTFDISSAAPSLAVVTAGISDQLVRVWGYAAGVWQMYDPLDVPGSDLPSLTAGLGYWVKVSADATLTYGQNSLPLTTGWNLIGWR